MYRGAHPKRDLQKNQQRAASAAHQAFYRPGPPVEPASSAVSIRLRSPKMASALRVKNTRTLCEIGGDEHVAIALGLPLARVKELKEGIDFSDEMAFHMETALGLRPGFLDSLNMELSESTKAMLKSPSDAALSVHEGPSAPESPPTVYKIDHKASKDLGLSPPETQGALTESENPTMEQQAQTPYQQPSAATAPVAPVKRVRTEASPEELRLREVRKNNLAMLTSAPGAKSKVSSMAGMSPVNLSHRLHGPKNFDMETSILFCNALGLPAGWFEAPRTPEDIPEALIALLGKPTNKPAKVAAPEPTAAAPSPKPAVAATPLVQPTPAVESPAKAKEPQASVPKAEAADLKAARKNAMISAPQLTVVGSESRADAAPEAPAKRGAESPQLVLSPESNPVAEALSKTILMMSRKGTLSEKRALELLNTLMME